MVFIWLEHQSLAKQGEQVAPQADIGQVFFDLHDQQDRGVACPAREEFAIQKINGMANDFPDGFQETDEALNRLLHAGQSTFG